MSRAAHLLVRIQDIGHSRTSFQENTISLDTPYHLQQWLVSIPGIIVREEEILQAFPNISPIVINQMVQASMLFPVGTGVYYKNIRAIESRGLREV